MFAWVRRIVIIALAFALACQSKPAQTFPIAPDHSLSAPTYIQKGLPAIDHIWTGDDYLQAGVVLRTIAAADVTQLPRYGSPSSGAVFARIVSTDNFRQARYPLQATAEILQKLSQVGFVYTSAMTPAGVFDSELVELARFELELSHDSLQFLGNVQVLPPPHSQNDEKLQQDLAKLEEKVRKALAKVIDGCLLILAGRNYRPSELCRLAETFETNLQIISSLPAEAQQEIPVRVQRMIEQESDPSLRERLTRIAEALKKLKAMRN